MREGAREERGVRPVVDLSYIATVRGAFVDGNGVHAAAYGTVFDSQRCAATSVAKRAFLYQRSPVKEPCCTATSVAKEPSYIQKASLYSKQSSYIQKSLLIFKRAQ